MALGLRALFPLWLLLAAGARPAEAVDFIASETNCTFNDPVRTTQNFGTGSNSSGYRLEKVSVLATTRETTGTHQFRFLIKEGTTTLKTLTTTTVTTTATEYTFTVSDLDLDASTTYSLEFEHVQGTPAWCIAGADHTYAAGWSAPAIIPSGVLGTQRVRFGLSGTVLTEPTISFSGGTTPATIAPGAERTLSVTASDGDGGTVAVAWTGDGAFSSATGTSVEWTAPTNPGAHTVTATVTDDEGETAAATLDLRVVVPPTISASASPTTVDSGDTVQLTATASDPDGGDVTVTWAAAQGTFGSTTGASVSWEAPQVRASTGIDITATVTDDEGAEATTTVTVTVDPLPPAAPSGARVNGSRLTISFDKPLDSASEPAAGDFTVDVAGGRRSVADGGVAIAGSTVRLTLAAPVVAGEAVTVSYEKGANPLRDTNGNDVTSFSGESVNNDTPAPDPTDPPDPPDPTDPGNRSPTVSASCDPCEVGRGGVVRLTAAADDPDGDALAYAWSAPEGSFHGRTDAATARWRAPEATGRVTIRVRVSDGHGGSASAGVAVAVRNDNSPPAFESSEYAFELRENVDGSGRPVDLGAVAASDPDGDEVTYELASGDGRRFTVGARDGVVRYVGPGEDFESEPNRYRLAVRARDPHGAAAEVPVEATVVNVNDLPEAEDDEAVTDEDRAVTVDVLANDTDPDGDVLRVEWVSAAPHGTTAVAGGGVAYAPEADYSGTDRFTYVVSDGNGGTSTAAVVVTVLPVNDAPMAVGVIPDQVLDEAGEETTVELGPFFQDTDEDALTYRASSSDLSVATAAVSWATLTLVPVEYGNATVTVTAEDAGGLMATQTFTVGVSDRLVRRVAWDTLAGIARSHLASARMTLGRRVTAGGTEGSRLTVLGREVPLGRTAARKVAEQTLASWLSSWTAPSGGLGGAPGLGAVAGAAFGAPAPPATATGVMPAATGPGGLAAAGHGGNSAVSGGFGRSGGLGRLVDFGGVGGPLRGSEFLLAVGGGQDAERRSGPGRRWQVWGQGDIQTFQGSPSAVTGYDGELQTAYLGVDTWVTERWLAGVAAARSRGDGNWRVGGSRGSLATTLTAVHPYLQWSDGSTSVWVTAGGGWGAAKNVRRSGRAGESDLGLRLGLVELRRRLGAAVGGVELGVRADTAWAELRTGTGGESIDGQTVAVHQTRVGAELSRSVRLGGLTLAPFGEVHARRDGGAGQTGEGLEVVAGLRAVAGSVRVDAQGRILALHSATGYHERGLGLTVGVGNQEQEGLSLSFSPRWGDSAAGGGALWQEQVYGHYLPQGRDAWELSGRGGYGMRMPSGRLLTWFGSVSRSPLGSRVLVGGSFGVLG